MLDNTWLFTALVIAVVIVVGYLWKKNNKKNSSPYQQMSEILNKHANRDKHILYLEKKGQSLMKAANMTVDYKVQDGQGYSNIISDCTVEVFDEQLIITSSNNQQETRIIPLYEFYAVHSEEEDRVVLLSLNLITNHKEKMTISGPSSELVQSLADLLKKKIFRVESGEQLVQSNRKLLIFINPKSGSGQSLQNFENIVKPMITESHIGNNFEFIVSKRSGHIKEYCEKELDLSKVNEIIACGGDGTLNEVINGLIPRLEKEGKLDLLSKMRFGVIPTGSGNAVSCHFQKFLFGFNTITNDESLVKRGTLFICRGLCSPMDLWTVFQPGKGKTYGFVSFSFGGIADVDVDTEFIRFIGDFRFILGSVWYACFGRYYTGNLTIVQPKKYEYLKKQNGAEIEEFKGNHSINSAFVQTDLKSKIELDSPISRQFLSKELKEMGLTQYLDSSKQASIVNTEEYVKHEEVDQSFTYMFASNVSHAAADFVASHLSFHNDNLVDLMYVKKPASPLELLSILLSCEKGDYHNHDKWLYRKIKAMYFKPTSTKKSYLTIDGEAVEYVPIILENIGSRLNFIGGDIH
ncbi:diacylglycerol kinase [Naegleria gruberi]|uniref:Diacylglycerol kinase n=1 Tax=Naegleria gruberi TaxID=5762 RepID=D2V6H4_NAEGR|nr:diacylglycerol kinase [Naegleria gruberi]EFC47571.1 diacylglycerol kinase [Naegleria gruberi]|eukprot:XP_002680315.1 diacylglycerol kinase [Naegleria gruberi strain NEG-M]